MRSIEQTKLLNSVLSRILIPYIYTIRVLLARKIFHEENFLQGKFFPVTLMYSFRFYSIDYVAVIPTHRSLRTTGCGLRTTVCGHPGSPKVLGSPIPIIYRGSRT